MKAFFFISLFLMTFRAQAYDQSQVSITDYEFRRHVRPQLKSISNDFQTLFFALNDELTELKSSYVGFQEIGGLNKRVRAECKEENISQNCEKILAELEALLSKTLKNFSSQREYAGKNLEIGQFYRHSFELLSQRLAQALLKTQALHFQWNLIGNFGFDYLGYADQLLYLYDQFHSFLFRSSDPRFKNELNSFWVNFIRPVENFVLYQNNQDFFKSRLTEFNIRWNMLNVRLTKRNFNPSKQVATLLNIMHRRWNNILKVSLKPKG